MKILWLSIITFLIFSNFSHAKKTLTGLDIATNVYNRDNGKSSISEMTMILKSKKKSKTRTFIAIEMDHGNKNNWMILKFLNPTNIKNTSLLTIDIPGSDSLQWLFLPALNKTRKISSSSKGRRFVASDIFYEDMTLRDVKEDKHKRLKNKKYEGMDCYVIQSIPIDKKSTSYSKTISWIHPKTFIPVKINFYRKNKVIKTMKVKEMKNINNIWTVTHSIFEEVKSRHSTSLIVNKIKYNIPLKKDFFSKKNLESNSEFNSMKRFL